MKRAYGFTIVELLIVIVVIAILAAISAAAYGNVSNRANDSAVKNDLAQFAKQIKLRYVESGKYIEGGRVEPGGGGAATGHYFTFPGFTFQPSRSSYDMPPNGSGGINLVYCQGPDISSGNAVFSVLAKSASGQTFRHSSEGGLESLGTVSITSARGCEGIGYPRTYSYGYGSTSGWVGWIN